jgi:hypothetical protein
LLGYDPYKYYTGRGPFEAAGVGIDVRGGDIAFRVNFATVENGVVTGVDYNAEDGWYYANGTADTDQAVSKIRQGQRPSCAYAVRAFGPGGVYHGIKYDREIMDIEFQHLELPFKGGSLTIRDNEEGQLGDKILDLKSITEGLQLMADKFTSNFSDFLKDKTPVLIAGCSFNASSRCRSSAIPLKRLILDDM